MKTIYVYSTLVSDVAYTNHVAGGGDLPVDLPPVVIKGGAGVANERFVTPRGIVTTITETDLEYLRANKVFQMHEENGFIEVSESYVDPDKAAADMTGRDNSAPIVPQDLKPEEQPAAIGNAAPPEDDDAQARAPAPAGRKRR